MIPAISGAIGPLGPAEWSVGSVGGLGADATTGAGAAAPAAGSSGSFSSALTDAINSFEQTQVSASAASQQLATGQATDPTQAITAVEDASLETDLASQISSKLTGALTTLFGTQLG
jgi:flagellar hook-basal body complex protein FliE